MKIISISDEYFAEFADGDREFMQKHGRPCLLVVRLRFRGRRRDQRRDHAIDTAFITSRCSPLKSVISAGFVQQVTLITRKFRESWTNMSNKLFGIVRLTWIDTSVKVSRNMPLI